MKTLAWMTLQVVIIGVVIWNDWSMTNVTGDKFHFGGAFIVGVVAAFVVTGSIVVLQDLFRRFFRPAPASPEGGETGRNGNRLAGPNGSGRNAPKIGSGNRVGQEPRKIV